MGAVLIADKNGNAKEWCGYEDAINYIVRNKVIYESGAVIKTYYGGKNETGLISQIDIHAILCVSGPLLGKRFYERTTQYAERRILYHRDLFICAYCGREFPDRKLTIDHVIPKSRGGKNTWMNTVSACKKCNSAKADQTPEEAEMPLLYLPYAPNSQEKLIMQTRNILADQMQFLMARVPKHSRLWKVYQS